MASRRSGHSPHEVEAIRQEIVRVLSLRDDSGRVIGDCKCGIYAFYDYDKEPIYVGQTNEKLRVRIRRHLTNHRTDAVAMHVLDPFEVLEIEMWPFWELADAPSDKVCKVLNGAEYTVFQHLLKQSRFGAVLNEVPVAPAPTVKLPQSYRGAIVPEDVFRLRKHSDIRIARRATTISKLAQVISERSVQPGLRKTLLTQARRLEYLAKSRIEEVGGSPSSDVEDE